MTSSRKTQKEKEEKMNMIKQNSKQILDNKNEQWKFEEISNVIYPLFSFKFETPLQKIPLFHFEQLIEGQWQKDEETPSCMHCYT